MSKIEFISPNVNPDGLEDIREYYHAESEPTLADKIRKKVPEPLGSIVDAGVRRVMHAAENASQDLKHQLDPRYAIYYANNLLQYKRMVAGYELPVESALDKITGNPLAKAVGRIISNPKAVTGFVHDLLYKDKSPERTLHPLSHPTESYRLIDRSQLDTDSDRTAKLLDIYLNALGNDTSDAQLGRIGNKLSYYNPSTDSYELAPTNGRKTFEGYSLDLQNVWDISLDPYVDSKFTEGKTYLPKTPSFIEGVPSWVPAASFSITDGASTSQEVAMSFGHAISFINGYTKDDEFSMELYDNELGQWTTYFRRCLLATIDPVNRSLAPYKLVTFKITIYIMNPGLSIRYKRVLLGTLKDVKLEDDRTSVADVATLSVKFSIVGEIKDEQSYIPTPLGSNNDLEDSVTTSAPRIDRHPFHI